MKKIFAIIMILITVVMLVSCKKSDKGKLSSDYIPITETSEIRKSIGIDNGCNHQFLPATCLEAEICKLCGETKGKPLGHSFKNGICLNCGTSKVEGKKVLFLGDSICCGNEASGFAWSKRIEDIYKMQCTNASISGWYLSDVTGYNIVRQFDSAPDFNYDYIILQGGVNDVWSNKPEIGAILPKGDLNFNLSTVAGALENLLYTAKQRYPRSNIGFIINYLPNVGKNEEWYNFVKLAKQICDKWGVSYLSLDDAPGFRDEFNPSKHLRDGVHPNSEGYDILTKYIINWIFTL